MYSLGLIKQFSLPICARYGHLMTTALENPRSNVSRGNGETISGSMSTPHASTDNFLRPLLTPSQTAPNRDLNPISLAR